MVLQLITGGGRVGGLAGLRTRAVVGAALLAMVGGSVPRVLGAGVIARVVGPLVLGVSAVCEVVADVGAGERVGVGVNAVGASELGAMTVGMAVGVAVGSSVVWGVTVGFAVGFFERVAVGDADGVRVGARVGNRVGKGVGCFDVGDEVGDADGVRVGSIQDHFTTRS